MWLLLCPEPLLSGWFVGNSEHVEALHRSKATVLNCGANGRGPAKLYTSFAGKGGKMPALLSSKLSTTCPRAVPQHMAEQPSGGVAVSYPGRAPGKNCCYQTKPNSCPFPQCCWLHTILRGSFLSPGADLVLEKQMMIACGLCISLLIFHL